MKVEHGICHACMKENGWDKELKFETDKETLYRFWQKHNVPCINVGMDIMICEKHIRKLLDV